MSDSPPIYLNFGRVDIDSEYSPDEILYRRQIPNTKNPPNEYFAETSWDDIVKGISVNRSKYCNNPADVFWSITSNNGDCHYTFKEGCEVITCKFSSFKLIDTKHGVCFSCIHSPWLCNYSHCDIFPQNIPAKLDKKIRRDIKLFFASFFKEIE